MYTHINTYFVTFYKMYPEEVILRQESKVKTREYPNPDTLKADMSIKISKNRKFLGMVVSHINKKKNASWVKVTIEPRI